MKLFAIMVIGCMLAMPVSAEETAELKLSIPDAISIALANNLDLKVERIAPDIKKEDVTRASSAFDPTVSASGTHSRIKTDGDPVEMESAENRIEAGIGKTYPYGTQLGLNLTLKDDSNTTNSDSEIDGTSLSTVLSVTQPLIKDRGRSVNEHQVVLAQNEYEKASLSFRQAVIDTVAETKKLYWRLYSDTERLTVQKKSLSLAEQFLSDVEEKVRIGSAAMLEILEARAEVASREEALIRAEYNLMNSQDNLWSFIYGNLEGARPIRCTQNPKIQEMEIAEDELLKQALDLRSDYRSLAYDIASADADIGYLENQKRAQLDVVGSLGYNKALSEEDNRPLAYQDYASGEIGLRLKFPWGFRQDEANYRAAMQRRRQLNLTRDTLDAKIRLELRKAARSVTSAHKQFLSASLAAQLAEEKLAAEQEKYKSGLSTSYNVLLYQRDWIDAMVKRVDATINYQLAIIFLNQTVGMTLEENQISMKDQW